MTTAPPAMALEAARRLILRGRRRLDTRIPSFGPGGQRRGKRPVARSMIGGGRRGRFGGWHLGARERVRAAL
jgi:hypothetical protein